MLISSSWPCTNCWADAVAQAEAAKEARLRGPQAFALERLLAVYWALLRSHVDAPQPAAAEQSAELHMQLATMVELRLLSRVPPLCLDRDLRSGFTFRVSWWSCNCCRGCVSPVFPEPHLKPAAINQQHHRGAGGSRMGS